MDEEWDFTMPLVAANEEGADFKHKNKGGVETHRVNITGYDKNPRATVVKGRLLHVVHGYNAGGKGTPSTLIVFEWLFVPGERGRRFREVQIDVVFAAKGPRSGLGAGGDLSDWDPSVETVSPSIPQQSYVTSYGRTDKTDSEISLTGGYQPFVGVTPKYSKGSTVTVERTDYRFVAGFPTYVGKHTGDPNAVHWTLLENETQISGLPSIARTAVLLHRQKRDFGKFVAKVSTTADVSILENLKDKIRRAIGEKDDPIIFDPAPPRADWNGVAVLDAKRDVEGRESPFDQNNLGSKDLDSFSLKDKIPKLDRGKAEDKKDDDTKDDKKDPVDEHTVEITNSLEANLQISSN